MIFRGPGHDRREEPPGLQVEEFQLLTPLLIMSFGCGGRTEIPPGTREPEIRFADMKFVLEQAVQRLPGLKVPEEQVSLVHGDNGLGPVGRNEDSEMGQGSASVKGGGHGFVGQIEDDFSRFRIDKAQLLDSLAGIPLRFGNLSLRDKRISLTLPAKDPTGGAAISKERIWRL